MSSESQRKATRKYDRENKVTLTFKLNKNTEADLVEYVNGLPNKQGLFKTLLREAMEAGREE